MLLRPISLHLPSQQRILDHQNSTNSTLAFMLPLKSGKGSTFILPYCSFLPHSFAINVCLKTTRTNAIMPFFLFCLPLKTTLRFPSVFFRPLKKTFCSPCSSIQLLSYNQLSPPSFLKPPNYTFWKPPYIHSKILNTLNMFSEHFLPLIPTTSSKISIEHIALYSPL